MKATGSLKLWSSILINKQVSKRGQITVKPSKDGCVWNNPRRQVNQRDPDPTLGSLGLPKSKVLAYMGIHPDAPNVAAAILARI